MQCLCHNPAERPSLEELFNECESKVAALPAPGPNGTDLQRFFSVPPPPLAVRPPWNGNPPAPAVSIYLGNKLRLSGGLG